MNRPPISLSQFALKVHSRCDLASDHCYVYEAADQSWRGRRASISDAVISQAAWRTAEHARLRRVVTELHAAVGGACRFDLRIHKNGVFPDEDFCEVFAEHGVKVGISIDNDRAANDRRGRYASGRSSYDKVIRAIDKFFVFNSARPLTLRYSRSRSIP